MDRRISSAERADLARHVLAGMLVPTARAWANVAGPNSYALVVMRSRFVSSAEYAPLTCVFLSIVLAWRFPGYFRSAGWVIVAARPGLLA